MGLEGGNILRLTVDEVEATALAETLSAAGEGGWRRLDAEEGDHMVDLSKVHFLRLVPGEVNARVGFGGGS